VKHLWLCKACSEIYTLVYRAGFGVLFESRFPRPSDHHEVRLITAA
jgi:hypothetical protein